MEDSLVLFSHREEQRLSLLHEDVSRSETSGPGLRELLGFGHSATYVVTMVHHRERGLAG